jgi:recombination protein RecT
MARKTVLRRHSKVLPMSGDLIDTFERDDAEEARARGAARLLEQQEEKPVVVPTAEQLDAVQIEDRSGTEAGVTLDMETGEIITDPRTGMTEVDEETARALDQQHEGGRADHEHGDQQDGTEDDPRAVWIDTMHDRIEAATKPADLRGVEAGLKANREGLEAADADALDAAIKAKRAALLKGAETMAFPDSFFIVWNPEGQRPPKFRHGTFGQASGEATRLARENPGAEFFVMEAKRSVRVRDLQVTDFASNDDVIPF